VVRIVVNVANTTTKRIDGTRCYMRAFSGHVTSPSQETVNPQKEIIVVAVVLRTV
jgi:hypothetical protein